MANMLDVHEYSRYSLDELVDMIKNLEHRIEYLEHQLFNTETEEFLTNTNFDLD